MPYQFCPGQRVYIKSQGRQGEVVTCVPGNGSFPWYFVLDEDGIEDRYTSNDLEAI